jgi:hypothetical protein
MKSGVCAQISKYFGSLHLGSIRLESEDERNGYYVN